MHVRTLNGKRSRTAGRIRWSLRIIRVFGLRRCSISSISPVASCSLLLELLEPFLTFLRRGVDELLFQTQDAGL
jgi:hypothetical protein